MPAVTANFPSPVFLHILFIFKKNYMIQGRYPTYDIFPFFMIP